MSQTISYKRFNTYFNFNIIFLIQNYPNKSQRGFIMRYVYTILLFFLFVAVGNSQYSWQLKHSGNSLGNPIGVYPGNTNIIYYGSNNVIYKSTDRGETFSQMGTPIPGSQSIDAVIPSSFSPNTLVVGLHAAGDMIVKTTNAGQSWTIVANGLTFSYFGIPVTPDPSHPDTLYTMSQNIFMKSTDFGSTWTNVSSVTGWSTPCDIEVFPDSSNIILAGDNGTGIWRSSDYGVTWSQKFYTGGEIPTITTSKQKHGYAWATKWSGGGGYVQTTDYGMTWNYVNYFNGNYLWGTSTNPQDSNYVMAACYSCGNVYMSRDGGNTWMPTSISPANYAVVIVDSMTVFAAQSGGIYKLNSPFFVTPVELTNFSANANGAEVTLNWSTATETNNKGFEIQRNQKSKIKSQNWEKIGFTPGHGTTTEPNIYSFVDNSVSSGNYIYRLEQVDYDGTFKYSKEVEADVNIPVNFSLEQNHPNPFNPSTIIEFTIPSDAFVKIKLFNLLGQEVTNIVNANYSAGHHSINFNAANLSSGIYFYMLEATGPDGSAYHAIKKMILLK